MDDNKEIRFVDILGRTIFTIPDGGHICAARRDGEHLLGHCVYSDENHVEINGTRYNIHQFADLQFQYGATVEPMEKPEIIDGYRVFNKFIVGHFVFFAAVNEQAQPDKRYTTWQENKIHLANGQPRYFGEKFVAMRDFYRRAEDAHRGVPNRPAKSRKERACR